MFNPFKTYKKTTYTATALTAVAAGVVFSPVALPAMAITAAQAVLATAAAAVAVYSVYAVGFGLLNLGRALINKFTAAPASKRQSTPSTDNDSVPANAAMSSLNELPTVTGNAVKATHEEEERQLTARHLAKPSKRHEAQEAHIGEPAAASLNP